MTNIISFNEYRKRVGVRINYLLRDGRPMTMAEYRRIPTDDTFTTAIKAEAKRLDGVMFAWLRYAPWLPSTTPTNPVDQSKS